jgi:DNA-binding transcriptional LysR family regulator
MDKARDLEILVASVDRGGFTGAAEALGLTPSAVSKAMTRLEARLGVRLLERTTRRVIPTREGASLVEEGRRILAAIEDAEAAVVEGRGAPRGLVRVASSVAFAIEHLAPALPDFRARHPEVDIDLGVSDRVVDIIGDGFDVGIRTGPPQDDRLVARRFAEIRRVICGAPDYLARHGTPRSPDDLARHVCINISTAPHLSLWPFRGPSGPRLVETRGRVVVDDANAILALGLAGLGLFRLGDFITARAIRSGALVPVLVDQHVSEPVPLHLVHPPGRQRLPKVRVFLDFVAERFGSNAWRV